MPEPHPLRKTFTVLPATEAAQVSFQNSYQVEVSYKMQLTLDLVFQSIRAFGFQSTPNKMEVFKGNKR